VVQAIRQSQVSEESSRHDVTYRVVHPVDGTIRHLRSIGKTFFIEGKACEIRGVIQDVTAQVRYQQQIEESEALLKQRVTERTQELENLNQELKRSNDSLEEFAYAASHDMKEPIRKILFFSDRLKQELEHQLNGSQSQLFGRMEHAAKRMALLIEDLLTYSHVSRGVSHLEAVDLNQKVKNVLEDLELNIQEKGAILHVAPLPVIQGHRRQLQQLFQNLIGNALKYAKPGEPPEIHITSQQVQGRATSLPLKGVTADKWYHLIQVRDNGIGFEQSDAERIFNVFTRLHGNAEYRGTGVGLSIAKKVIDNHHGYIWAESEPGAGATFRVLLPAE
jgi:light-regulated signal transduction histidine kinase (bacteriophytochrome)